MLQHLRPACVLLSLLTILTGLAYPLAITGLARALFPHQAGGSLIVHDGRTIGSGLIGQNFISDRYFHGRPSATSSIDPADPSQTIASPYNAAASSGSNLGPTSKALIDRIRADVEKLQAENPGQPVPVDLVTTSASGLDPDLSIAAAQFQIPRIARARGIDAARLQALVEAGTEPRLLALIGEPVVRVLALNLALDQLADEAAPSEARR
jgi:K+-transporting ATPase ATPase C chain